MDCESTKKRRFFIIKNDEKSFFINSVNLIIHNKNRKKSTINLKPTCYYAIYYHIHNKQY